MAHAPLLKVTVGAGLLATMEIYPDKVIYRELLKRIVINREQIASVTSYPLTSGIVIETTGGKRYLMLVSLWQKKKVLALLD